MVRKIRVGTRKSNLAIAQGEWVIRKIKRKFSHLKFELVSIKTKGDIVLDRRLDKIGGKGLFIKELENALLNNVIDIAVHSAKDIPAELPEELAITAVSAREDPRDVLVTSNGIPLEDLKKGAIIGTSSARREAQILDRRPDLKVKLLRGNVNTRLDKAMNNEYDAVILAAAGLKRLGLDMRCLQFFDIEDIIPAVGQGILGIETRKNSNVDYLRESVHCENAALQLNAERAFMIKLQGDCTTPIAAHAVIKGEKMKVYGMLATDDKTLVYKDTIEGSKENAACLGKRLADRLLTKLKQEAFSV